MLDATFADQPLVWTVERTAAELGVTEGWLNKMRGTGGGPPFAKIGRRIGYRPADVAAWLETRMRRNTAQEPRK